MRYAVLVPILDLDGNPTGEWECIGTTTGEIKNPRSDWRYEPIPEKPADAKNLKHSDIASWSDTMPGDTWEPKGGFRRQPQKRVALVAEQMAAVSSARSAPPKPA